MSEPRECSCVRPAATYCFSVAPFTDTQLHSLDSLMTAAYKHAYGLPTQASSALAHAALTAFGLGCASLHVEYHHTSCEQFVRAQSDDTTYGDLSRALLQQQVEIFTPSPSTPQQRATTLAYARYSFRLRQLSSITRSSLTLLREGQPQFGMAADQVRIATTAASHLDFIVGSNSHVTHERLVPLTKLGVTDVRCSLLAAHTLSTRPLSSRCTAARSAHSSAKP